MIELVVDVLSRGKNLGETTRGLEPLELFPLS